MKKMMTLFLLILAFFAAGCWVEDTVVTFEADGSGRVEQTLVLSDRLLVAGEDDRSDMNIPLSEEELRRMLAGAVEVDELSVVDLPNGERRIAWSGSFSSAEDFLASEFCRESLSLNLREGDDGRRVLAWWGGPVQESHGSSMDLTVDQLYGLMKGLHQRLTLHLPGPADLSYGESEDGGKTVIWQFDLRNREGLTRTKEFMKEADGEVTASIDRADLDLDFQAFLASTERRRASSRMASNVDVNTDEIRIAPTSLVWTKVRNFSEEQNNLPETNAELHLEMGWDREMDLKAFYAPVLLSARDDSGRNLVPEEEEDESDRPRRLSGTKTQMQATLLAPALTSVSLVDVTGHVVVVTNYSTTDVRLDDPKDAVDQEETGVEGLDEHSVKIDALDGRQLKFSGGLSSDKIEAIRIVQRDGRVIDSHGHGGGGWDDSWSYTYSYPEGIEEAAAIEFVIRTQEHTVTVPFEFDRLELP